MPPFIRELLTVFWTRLLALLKFYAVAASLLLIAVQILRWTDAVWAQVLVVGVYTGIMVLSTWHFLRKSGLWKGWK